MAGIFSLVSSISLRFNSSTADVLLVRREVQLYLWSRCVVGLEVEAVAGEVGSEVLCRPSL